jgi:hypothetical protein
MYCCKSVDVYLDFDLERGGGSASPEAIANVWELEEEAGVIVAPFHSRG